ncbi:MAG: hypothetical protein F6J96_34455 [Symploca sp. SIO1C2]|nr:hypothetical protein [Symploca sp. SIO1C2]
MQYQNLNFITPPFAEYVSGHSTFSFASAVVLRNFFGSDEYGGSVTIAEGESAFEPRIDDPTDPNYAIGSIPNSGPRSVGYVPATDITLSWETFSDAASEAGRSRLYGGIHIELGNTGGAQLGTLVGEVVWKKYQSLLGEGSRLDTKGSKSRMGTKSSASF